MHQCEFCEGHFEVIVERELEVFNGVITMVKLCSGCDTLCSIWNSVEEELIKKVLGMA